MKCNIGKTDRIIRAVVGVVIIAAGFAAHSWLGLIGLIPLATAATGYCHLYTLLKFDTKEKAAAPDKA
jgi:hypothetical protein